MRPRKFPKRYSCIYHSDEDVRDKGLTIGMLMAILSFFIVTYTIFMLSCYQEEIEKFFYNILKFFWL